MKTYKPRLYRVNGSPSGHRYKARPTTTVDLNTPRTALSDFLGILQAVMIIMTICMGIAVI